MELVPDAHKLRWYSVRRPGVAPQEAVDVLLDLHRTYPQYGFDQHKGYPTAMHLARLQQHGVSPVHRRSYAPVRALLDRVS